MTILIILALVAWHTRTQPTRRAKLMPLTISLDKPRDKEELREIVEVLDPRVSQISGLFSGEMASKLEKMDPSALLMTPQMHSSSQK